MQRSSILKTASTGLSIVCACACAQAQDRENTVRFGIARSIHDTRSGDLSGPFTPPGIKIDITDANLLALSYERRLTDNWSVMFQAGTPLRLHFEAVGTAAGVGPVVSTKLWIPSLLLTYNFAGIAGIRSSVGAGINYSRFSNAKATPAYTNAMGGSSTSVSLDSGWSPVLRLAVEIPLGDNWVVDFSYFRYWISTTTRFKTVTPTPGGNIEIARTLAAKPNASVFGVVLGYRF